MNGSSIVDSEWSTFNRVLQKWKGGIRGRGNEKTTTVLEEE
jgi:hypothetical protein